MCEANRRHGDGHLVVHLSRCGINRSIRPQVGQVVQLALVHPSAFLPFSSASHALTLDRFAQAFLTFPLTIGIIVLGVLAANWGPQSGWDFHKAFGFLILIACILQGRLPNLALSEPR